jgi:molybdenum cofactor cytidylyltransferase
MIAGLILAAGESRRMGRDKALLTYRGLTFVETIVASLSAGGIANITLVLGHHADLIQRSTNLNGVRVVVNGDYQRGQTSSLQAGLAALTADSPDGIVLCLVDHPAISSDVVATLISEFRSSRAPLVIPKHKGERGHPVLIGKNLFPELLALPYGQAANTVIRRYYDQANFVDVADAGILIDVDEPETYERLAKK